MQSVSNEQVRLVAGIGPAESTALTLLFRLLVETVPMPSVSNVQVRLVAGIGPAESSELTLIFRLSAETVLKPSVYSEQVRLVAEIGPVASSEPTLKVRFVAETEHQVVEHLRSHIEKLPEDDEKSRAILEQMKIDEGHHASMAIASGAAELPLPIKKLMKLSSLVMTTTAYWI